MVTKLKGSRKQIDMYKLDSAKLRDYLINELIMDENFYEKILDTVMTDDKYMAYSYMAVICV